MSIDQHRFIDIGVSSLHDSGSARCSPIDLQQWPFYLVVSSTLSYSVVRHFRHHHPSILSPSHVRVMSSPPPPYSSQSPPEYLYSWKLPACPPHQSSRQTLSVALQRARHAVQLDTSGSNIPSAVAAYSEAIELLQWVIARRSRKPGNEAEVERVMDIVSLPSQFVFCPCLALALFLRRHAPCAVKRSFFFFFCALVAYSQASRLQHDRYVQRVRELCRARRLPLPSHVADAPSASRHPVRDRTDGDAVSPTSALESDWDTEPLLLSSSSSSSSSSMTGDLLSSASSVDSAPHHHRHHLHEWIVSEACDEELKEWGQYLTEGANDRRASVATAASAVWSTIAVSHG